jgi:hypothetical protein
MLWSMKEIYGFTIGATDGDVGTVAECYFDDVSFTVRWVVVDTGGWLANRRVLVSPMSFRAMDWEHRRITAALTKLQVEQSPDVDTDKPVSRQHEAVYYGYYGYDPPWAGDYLWGASPYPNLWAKPAPTPAVLARERRWNWEDRHRGDPHLRSTREVTGYHIHATDGNIGHVEDFLVDETSWAVRYLVVDTTNWWAGKKVLVAPTWVERVDWDHSKVHVSVVRAQVETSPVYNPVGPVERAYEERLYCHYGQPRYWTD